MQKKKAQPKKKIVKASKSKSISSRRAAPVARPGVIRKRAAFSRALTKRSPGSFPGFVTSAWANSVQHPFSERGFKIPDLVTGPPSVLLCTTDLNNTASGNVWPESSVTQSQTYQMTDGIINIVNQPSINTTGQQLMVQFLPCTMSPASFLATRTDVELIFQGATNGAADVSKLIGFLAGMMENAADKITPVLGWWMTLDSDGYIKGVGLLQADKLRTTESSLKLLRMTKAGLKVTLQQPKFATGGQVYLNKGASALLPFYSINDQDGDGVVGGQLIERLTTFRVGQRCMLGEGTEYASKANVVKLLSKTAGTHVEALDVGGKSHTIASYPLDSVKALEYMPYGMEDPFMFSSHLDKFDGTAAGFSTLDKQHNPNLTNTAPMLEVGLNVLTGGDDGILSSTNSSVLGYNPDSMHYRWCPGFMVFHPTFTTSISPEKIIANLEIETYTAWEFVPHPRTFAHLARTPGHLGRPDSRVVPPVKDSMSGKGGHTHKNAPSAGGNRRR